MVESCHSRVWLYGLLVALAVTCFGSLTTATAFAFPTRPVEMIVPCTAGGSIDLAARITAKHAAKYLGQNIVIVNRPPAATGTTFVANARPDGYTIGSWVPAYLYMHRTLPGVRHTIDSFRGIIQVADDPMVLAVRTGSRTDLPLPELIEYVRQHPDEVTIGIGQAWGGFDLARTMIEDVAGIKFRRVAFDGGAPATTALLGGHIDVLPIYPGEVLSHVEAGTLELIAIASEERLEFLPDVPTFREAGYDVIASNLRLIMAPAGVPDDRIEVLHDAFKKAYDDPEWKQEMVNAGFFNLVYKGTTELDAYLQETNTRLERPLELMLAERDQN